MLNKPYTIRVAGALLLKTYFFDDNISKNKFLQDVFIKIQQLKINTLDPERILQIIYAESASQSIRSLAGDDYDSRFQKLVISQGFEYQGQTFDKNFKSVEYDAILKVHHINVGVSIKRTLRERYKQNHENVDLLMVDIVLLVTLGIDLNEDKIHNIIAKKGNFIVVASDIYNQNIYMQKYSELFPANQLNKKKIMNLYQSMNCNPPN